MTDAWAKSGEKVRFLGRNGYDHQLEQAMGLWKPGQELTVISRHIGDWSSTYEFAEVPGNFNTVMFEQCEEAARGNETENS